MITYRGQKVVWQGKKATVITAFNHGSEDCETPWSFICIGLDAEGVEFRGVNNDELQPKQED